MRCGITLRCAIRQGNVTCGRAFTAAMSAAVITPDGQAYERIHVSSDRLIPPRKDKHWRALQAKMPPVAAPVRVFLVPTLAFSTMSSEVTPAVRMIRNPYTEESGNSGHAWRGNLRIVPWWRIA